MEEVLIPEETGLPGRQTLHTDTGHLQLLSLNQIPASSIISAVSKYPGLWHAESSPQTHTPFPSFILLSLLLPASPSCPAWSSPAAGNCSAVIFRVLQVALLICLLHCFFISPYLPLPLPLIAVMKAEKNWGERCQKLLVETA